MLWTWTWIWIVRPHHKSRMFETRLMPDLCWVGSGGKWHGMTWGEGYGVVERRITSTNETPGPCHGGEGACWGLVGPCGGFVQVLSRHLGTGQGGRCRINQAHRCEVFGRTQDLGRQHMVPTLQCVRYHQLDPRNPDRVPKGRDPFATLGDGPKAKMRKSLDRSSHE